MRRPTPLYEQLRWHHNALKGEVGDIHEAEPHCGWYKRRLVKGGPLVPVRIYLFQDIDIATGELVDDEKFLCTVNGHPADPFDQWTYVCTDPISREEFDRLTFLNSTAGPDRPEARPHDSIDFMTVPLPFAEGAKS